MVQVGNSTPIIATKTEQEDVVVSYNVVEDTYVYIYAIIDSNNAPLHSLRASSQNIVKIYGFSVIPGITSINNIDCIESDLYNYYTTDGRRINGHPLRKGIYIRKGKRIVVK